MRYETAHARVQRARGKASQYKCVDCGNAAEHWSYTYESDTEVLDPVRGCPISSDPMDYEPRCIRCHAYFDETAAFYRGTQVPAFAAKFLRRDRAAARNGSVQRLLEQLRGPEWLTHTEGMGSQPMR